MKQVRYYRLQRDRMIITEAAEILRRSILVILVILLLIVFAI
jgi:hypothetical protein